MLFTILMAFAVALIVYVVQFVPVRSKPKVLRPSVAFYEKTAYLEHQVDLLPHLDEEVLAACAKCNLRVTKPAPGWSGVITTNEARKLGYPSRGFHYLEDGEHIL